jgi:hypothetical protein
MLKHYPQLPVTSIGLDIQSMTGDFSGKLKHSLKRMLCLRNPTDVVKLHEIHSLRMN